MSIQQNTKALQDLLDTANANLEKANALPDAGGSGGGAAVETCTLTVLKPDGPILSGMAFAYAVADDFSLLEIDLYKTASYDILKNTIVVVSSNMADFRGDVIQLVKYGSIFVTGNCSVQYSG